MFSAPPTRPTSSSGVYRRLPDTTFIFRESISLLGLMFVLLPSHYFLINATGIYL